MMSFIRKCAFGLAAVFLSAGSQASWAQDTTIHYPQQLTMSPKGVNLQTGKFTYTKADLAIGPLSFVRSWGDIPNFHISSKVFGVRISPDGKRGGWGHSFGQGLRPATESNVPYLYVYVDGKQFKFTSTSSGVIYPWSKPTVGASFDGNVMTDQAGNRFTFNGYTGNATTMVPLSRAEYADGHTISYTYNAAQQPKLITSNKGYALVIEYNAGGNITAVCGFNTAATYVDSSTGCAGTALKTTYAYDATDSHLTAVTDPVGRVVNISGAYVYGGNQVIGPTCISLANSSTCEIQNFYRSQPDGIGTWCCYKPFQVGQQIDANGGIWLYNWGTAPEDPRDVPPVTGRPVFSETEGSGPMGWYYYSAFDRGTVIDLIQPTGTFNYKYMERSGTGLITYDFHDTTPSLITYPDGHREYFTHDLRSNVTFRFVWPNGAPPPVDSVSGGPLIPTDPDLARCCISTNMPIVTGTTSTAATYKPDYAKPGTSYLFPSGCGNGPADAKLCNKPTSSFNEEAKQTDYSYDPAHGGLLKKTLPAVQVNGAGPEIRPEVRYEYAQRYAWVKNASGTYTQSSTPVWVKTRERSCRTTASSGQSCVGGAADEVITEFEYGPDSGPNNLELRGVAVTADGQTLRTCYGYDTYGRKISETQPKAGLAVCS